MSLPPIGSHWTHPNGEVYEVVLITNLANKDRYPTTICYVNILTREAYSRPASDWDRNMRPAV